ncbi:MAG: PKD domain-containing protein [Spirochaetaceae bacterium]
MKHVLAKVFGAGVVLALAVALVGCPGLFGGGGGGNGNQPPVAGAGEDVTAFVGAVVTLDGTGSSDPDGDTLTYVWSFEVGPSGSAISNNGITSRNSAKASFVPDVAGEYEFTLTVSDDVLSDEDSVVVTATLTPEDAAVAFANEGIDALKDQDWDLAHSKFSLAVDADSTNGLAAIGYALLDVMDITIDPEMISLAKDRLGLVGYPDSMNALFSDGWFEDYDYEGEDGVETYYGAPEISGEWSYDEDGDGYLDPGEKGLAFMAYFAGNNTAGFNAAIDDVAELLTGRLDTTLSAIDAVPGGAEIRFTWDMFFDSESEAINSWWPEKSGDAIEFVVGKEEAMLLGVELLLVRHQVHLAQVLDYILPLNDYWATLWNDYMDDGVVDGDYPSSPLVGTFLEPEPLAEAEAALEAAKEDMEAALTDFIAATGAIEQRVSDDPYSLSPGSDFLGSSAGPDSWSEILAGVRFEKRIAEEIQASMSTSDLAYFPYPADGSTNYDGFVQFVNWALDNWPTEIAGDEPEAAFNFGVFYADPLVSISNIFELREANDITDDDIGEPVFYTLENGSFVELTDHTGLLAEPPHIYLKMPDVSLGGAIDPDSFPEDDPAGEYYVSFYFRDDDEWIDNNEKWEYQDDNTNNAYDPGEPAEWFGVDFDADVSGLIPYSTLASDYDNDPIAYYQGILDALTPNDINDDDLYDYVYDLDGIDGEQDEVADLKAYVNHEGWETWLPPIFVRDGNAVYFCPDPNYPEEFAELAANSLTNEDADLGDIHGDGDTDYSSGSFWLALMYPSVDDNEDGD